MNRIFPFALVLVLAPFAIHNAAASDSVVQKPLISQTLDGFTKDSARIEQQMRPGGLYGYISATEKSRVEMRLADMRKLLAAHVNASEMPQSDKVALFNAQEEINGILSHNDANRLICQRVNPVGSHIPVTTCHTYAEIMAERERTQHDMERQLSTPQLRSGS